MTIPSSRPFTPRRQRPIPSSGAFAEPLQGLLTSSVGRRWNDLLLTDEGCDGGLGQSVSGTMEQLTSAGSPGGHEGDAVSRPDLTHFFQIEAMNKFSPKVSESVCLLVRNDEADSGRIQHRRTTF